MSENLRSLFRLVCLFYTNFEPLFIIGAPNGADLTLLSQWPDLRSLSVSQKEDIRSKIKPVCDSQILQDPDLVLPGGVVFRLSDVQHRKFSSYGSKTRWESSINDWLASWLAKSFHTTSVSDRLDSLWSSLNTYKASCLHCDRGMGSGLSTEATCWRANSEILRFEGFLLIRSSSFRSSRFSLIISTHV